MSNARNIARLLPNSSGQLPAGNIQDASISSAKLSGKIGDSNMVAGSVVQMVHVNSYCNESTTTDGLVTASASISITPKFASSKIFVFFDILVYGSGSGTGGFRTAIARKVGSGATQQIVGSGYFGTSGHNISNYEANWSSNHQRVPWTVTDFPNTTQQVTYYPMYGLYNGGMGGTIYLGNGGNQYANFTLWEIAQ